MHTHNTIYCQYTGVKLGVVSLADFPLRSCASLTWQAEWKQLIAEHPLFSLSPNQCLRTSRIIIRELIKRGPAELGCDDNEVLAAEEAARVAFVAVLRNMGCIVRRAGSDKPAATILPTPATVIVHGQHLLQLAYWYANAQSPKFKFPQLNVTKLNDNTQLQDIGAFLQVCQNNKDEWTKAEVARQVRNVLDDPLEPNFLQAAAKAEAAVIGSSSRRLPKTALWNWFIAAIAAEDRSYHEHFMDPANINGASFHHAMFFAKDGALKKYTADDIDSLEELLMRYAPLGTVPYNSFRTELARMKNVVNKQTKAFTIDWSLITVAADGIKPAVQGVTPEGALIASEASKQQAELAAAPEPQREDYTSNLDYLRAKALWQLARSKQAAEEASTRRSQII